MSSEIQTVLDTVENMDINEQKMIVELLTKRLIENRRKEIKNNYINTLKAIKSGKAKKGNLKTLLNDLEQ
ncbi:MAG: hypothetical protein N2319_07400 [Candidatus Kapabacteria bacterium]|nr:hypothetical protein [Candidatus Kapabacteria bacterium]